MVGYQVAPRDRRADILAAALGDFARAGYAGARMERIAQSAGVNKQLPFHYFGSKEGLFAVALSRMLEAATPPVPASSATPAELLRRTLDLLELYSRQQPGVIAILAGQRADAGYPAEASAIIVAWHGSMLERLATAVSDGQRRGFFRDDLDPAVVARNALAAALGSGLLATSAAQGVSTGTFYADYCSWR